MNDPVQNEFERLVTLFDQTHQTLQRQAARTVDTALVVRNWLFGCYLVEYENAGASRAELYGKALIDRLAVSLAERGLRGTSATNLRKCRAFYEAYPECQQDPPLRAWPEIQQNASVESAPASPVVDQEAGSDAKIRQLASVASSLLRTSDPQVIERIAIGLAERFRLGWSHYVILLTLSDVNARRFYEVEAVAGSWGVRELERQVNSGLYERLALSRDKDEIRQLAEEGLVVEQAADLIKNPYVLEFLGLEEQTQYSEHDDARAALLEEIATRLVEKAAKDAPVFKKAKKLLGRVNWLRIAGLTAGSVAAMAAGLPPVGLIGAGVTAVQGMTDGDITQADIAGADKAGGDLAKAGAGAVQPAREESPPQQIRALRQQFQETLDEMKTTLVVFIDDLDRCLPTTAISTFEAIRLFLFLPRTAFVIAADDKMIRQAVRAHFKDVELDNDLVTNYFDKLVQIPLRVPPLGTQEVRAYLMLLHLKKAGLHEDALEEIRSKVCERLSKSWSGHRVDARFVNGLLPDISEGVRADLALADRLAPLMTTAPQINGNPRLIKRFLNTLRIRLAVAKAQDVPVEESTLAKVLLFERCASETAYRRLVAAVNEGDDGRPEFLATWERQARAGGPLDAWSRNPDTPSPVRNAIKKHPERKV